MTAAAPVRPSTWCQLHLRLRRRVQRGHRHGSCVACPRARPCALPRDVGAQRHRLRSRPGENFDRVDFMNSCPTRPGELVALVADGTQRTIEEVFHVLALSSVPPLRMLACPASLPPRIRPISSPPSRSVTFVFVPKVIHHGTRGRRRRSLCRRGIPERGIEIEVIWEQPPQADVLDQNKRIEANIGVSPTVCRGLHRPGDNVQMMNEAVEAGLNLKSASNSFCDDAFPFIGPRSSVLTSYDLKRRLPAERAGNGEGQAIQLGQASRPPITWSAYASRTHPRSILPHRVLVFEQPDDTSSRRPWSYPEGRWLRNTDIDGIFASKQPSDPIWHRPRCRRLRQGRRGRHRPHGMICPSAVDQFVIGARDQRTSKAQHQWDICYGR